jgi:NAD-dependent deacetylase
LSSITHELIAEVARRHGAQGGNVTVITQNIDGLHQRSGVKDPVELHGSLWRVRCTREGLVREDFELPVVRRCRRDGCGTYLRPDITWFEDALDAGVVAEAVAALEACDLIVSIGTSGVVYPAADLPRIAKRAGAAAVEINLEDTPVSHLYEHRLRGPASGMLPRILQGRAARVSGAYCGIKVGGPSELRSMRSKLSV